MRSPWAPSAAAAPPESWPAALLTTANIIAGHRRPGAASLTAPGLAPLVDRERGDRERDRRVSPPDPERGVKHQAGQDAGGEIGAEHVLAAFTGGRAGLEARPDPLLGAPQPRH